MTMLIHTTAVVAILVSAYVTYGGWRKAFAEKHYDLAKRMFPRLIVWPRTVHVVSYKVLTTTSFLAVTIIYLANFRAFG